MRNNKRKMRGFTMIELIIVIAILGILAAFALPRFADFTTEAKTATRDGIAASINAGINIAHAKWQSQGSTGTVTLDGGTAITMNASGYPDVGTTYNDATTCRTLVANLVSGTNTSTLNVSHNGTNCTIDSTKSWATPIVLSANSAS